MADFISNVVERPFDEEGVLPENYVQNEQRILENKKVRAIRPSGGSFFTDSFVLRDANHQLVNKSKYSFDLFSPTITEKLGRAIAGVAILKDETVPGPVYIDYRCVGGPWGASNEVIIDLFNRLQKDDRPTAWKDILGKPDAYKPAHHLEDIGDMYGAEYFVAALDRNTQAILMGDVASHDEILRSIDRLSAGVAEEVKSQINLLRSELTQYINQRDNYVLGEITKATDAMNVKFLSVNAAIDAINQRIAQLQQSSGADITALRQQVNNHISTTNAHNVTLEGLGGYSKSEVNQLIAQANSNLTGFVRKDAAENMSLSVAGGKLYSYINGTWQIIWPSQWVD